MNEVAELMMVENHECWELPGRASAGSIAYLAIPDVVICHRGFA
jgi:hypothetical protein